MFLRITNMLLFLVNYLLMIERLKDILRAAGKKVKNEIVLNKNDVHCV